MQRVLTVLLVVAGLALGGWALLDRTGDDIGTVTVGADEAAATSDGTSGDAPLDDATAEPSQPPSPSEEPTVTPSPTRAAPEIGRASGRIADVDLSPPPAPTRISLPTIAVDAPIVPVDIDPDGLMTVPEDVDTVGWYRFGSAPASTEGTTVLAGHVDDRVQGRGAFFDLRAMEVGDQFTVADDEGTTSTWRVTGRRTFEKASLPIADLFRRDGSPRLVLITCGGEFDRAARSYESNVVVEAEPLP